ncbi:hypothetical protein BJY00DRAFT_295519 [Aspergillus carlsbadensis]|nr:hypothetical protein BJY00DRAFT_295519 [Aspergillus carlsbadensis]
MHPARLPPGLVQGQAANRHSPAVHPSEPADVTLMVFGKPLLVHKDVLVRCSVFFAMVILHDIADSGHITLRVNGGYPRLLEVLFDFVYGRSYWLDEGAEFTEDLLAAANAFAMHEVVDEMKRRIRRRTPINDGNFDCETAFFWDY